MLFAEAPWLEPHGSEVGDRTPPREPVCQAAPRPHEVEERRSAAPYIASWQGPICPDLLAQQSRADEAIAAALDARLIERKSQPVPDVVGPVEGPTEPQLITVAGAFGKRASDQG
jgi:hypothetical protein